MPANPDALNHHADKRLIKRTKALDSAPLFWLDKGSNKQ
jgi:hypothetical protein